MNHSTTNQPVIFDHYRSSVQYHPGELTISVNRIPINRSYKSLSISRISESSSGIDIIDDESMETHSSDSEPLIIRYHSPSSSPCSRQVIIKCSDQTATFSNKPRRRRGRRMRRNRRNRFFNQNPSSSHFSNHKHHQQEYKDDRLKRLYDEYSSEQVNQQWKPLALIDSRELYQYALDKYHGKSFLN